MAKKKINIKTAASVPEGDVNVTYNNVRIAALSDSGNLTLETEDTICEHDIEVEYTKSGSDAPVGNIINITNNSSGNPAFFGPAVISLEGVRLDYELHSNHVPSGISKFFVYTDKDMIQDLYVVQFAIESDGDDYSVYVNNTPISFGKGAYWFYQYSEDTPIIGQTYNVVITDKV